MAKMQKWPQHFGRILFEVVVYLMLVFWFLPNYFLCMRAFASVCVCVWERRTTQNTNKQPWRSDETILNNKATFDILFQLALSMLHCNTQIGFFFCYLVLLDSVTKSTQTPYVNACFVSFYLLLLFTFQWLRKFRNLSHQLQLKKQNNTRKTPQSWLLLSQQTCLSGRFYYFERRKKIGEFHFIRIELVRMT